MVIGSVSRRRCGGITLWLFLLVIPLFAFVAFAVDLNYIWSVDGQLQSAADAAALAGAAQLLGPNLMAALPATGPAQWNAYQQQGTQAAIAAAQERASSETVAGSAVVLNSSDVQTGYIQDPTAAPDTPEGQFQPVSNGYFPNSVQVTARLDSTVPAGPLQLFFAPLLGTPSVSRQVTATATLRGQNVTGFSAGAGNRLLPVAISLLTYESLMGVPLLGNIGIPIGVPLPLGPLLPPNPPQGVNRQDTFTVTLPIAGGSQPPGNVTAGADSIPEVQGFPLQTLLGNFYLVSLRNAPATADSDYVSWILNGPSAADLATFGPKGLQAGLLSPATMYAGPKVDSAMDTALTSIVGQTRIVPVFLLYDPLLNPTFLVIGFQAVTVVAVNLQGPNPSLTLQPTSTLDPTATLGGGSGGGSAAFVYQRIALSR